MNPEESSAAIEATVREALAGSDFEFELIDCDPDLADTAQFCAHYGYPLVGDPTYSRLRIPGAAPPALETALRAFPRQALHAAHLELKHPGNRETLAFEAPIPPDMLQLLEILAKHDK